MVREQNLFKDEKKILLQSLAQKHKIELDEYELEKFSKEKSLLEYQQEALENAFSILNLYFNECGEDKKKFYEMLGVQNSLDLKLDKDDFLKRYFKIEGSLLKFEKIVNQMCFWMATGSGKTIVIIKLIEMLVKAMENGFIPQKDIFFFSANESLLEAFKGEVEAYNLGKNQTIVCHSLKDYENKNKNNINKNNIKADLFNKYIHIFFYNAYNLADESKDKQLDFKNVYNNGNNYVILDEAHKGNKSYSKMQHIMNILSQNGYLFNFSATFTSSQDIAMTVRNLNAVEWIQKGYGKKPLLLENSNLSAFKEKEDFNEKAKQKAILKSLIALHLCKMGKNSCQEDAYHDPMMLVFSNSVTAQNSDAHIFFKTLQSIVSSDSEALFSEAKEEIADDLKQKKYLIVTEDNESVEPLSNMVFDLTLDEVKEKVFHSAKGNLEALYYPSNINKIVFKLDSVETPFMLIRIGNIIEWLKTNLKGVKISKSHKDLESFKNIDKNGINILLGSKMFSEGWDTTRPNVTLFLNIGVDKEAKTFVAQSLGRTLRIESFNKDRRRAGFIEDGKKGNVALETVFILATNPTAIKAIVETTKSVGKKTIIKLEKNSLIPENLLIPKYKKEKKPSNEINQKSKIRVSKQNKEMARIYAKHTSNALMALRHNITKLDKIELVKKLCVSDNFNESKEKHYKSIDSLINEVQKRSFVNHESFNEFKKIGNEICHYQKIVVKEEERVAEVEASIKEVMVNKRDKEVSGAKYKYLEKHYYNPLICEKDSVNFSHIVREKSEIKFLEKLNKLRTQIDKKVKWWYFSKLEANVDEIYIPYIQDAKGRKFYPDFIFWVETKENVRKIIFVDPKGTEHADYGFKCDGFDEVFNANFYDKNKEKIQIQLWLIADDKEVSKGYAKWWLDIQNDEELMKIFS
ncbi:DEAD/DEAH box helicase family protein [Campylobacter upsaliensis]